MKMMITSDTITSVVPGRLVQTTITEVPCREKRSGRCYGKQQRKSSSMQKHRWFLMTLTVLMIVLLNSVLIYRVTPAQSASVSNADAAMRAYIKALYDPNAKYFYYDKAHTKSNTFWPKAISWT